MSIKSLTAAMLIGVVTLTGCTSMSEYRERLKQYDATKSYAMNVTRQFWQPKFQDTPVPKGVFVSNSTLGRDVTLSTMSWLAGGSSLLPGGFGLDLGMAFISEMGKKTPPDMLSHILAYVDASKFPTRKEAELEAVNQVYLATQKGLKDLGFTISKLVEPEHISFLWVNQSHAGVLFENEKLGCTPHAELGNNSDALKEKGCWLGVAIDEMDEDDLPATKVPVWMASGGTTAWPMYEKARIMWTLSKAAKVDLDTLYAATAKHLPDNYWLYVEPRKVEGKKGRTPPYLLDNKGTHFFVIEQETEKTAKR